MNSKILKLIFENGTILGIGLCLYTLFMWLSKLDSLYLNYGKYLDIVIFTLPMFIVFRTLKKAKEIYELTFLKRFIIACGITMISYVLYQPFLYYYHTKINPNWFDYVLRLKQLELNAENLSKANIDDVLLKMRKVNLAQSKLFSLSSVLSSIIVLPTIMTLLSFIFIRSTDK